MNRSILRNCVLWTAGCAAMVLTACHQEGDRGATNPQSLPTPDANSVAAAPGPPAPAVRPPSPTKPTAVAIPTSDPAATLNALSQAVRKYSLEKRQLPGSVADLAAAGYITSVPQAPSGKQFVINPKRMMVELVNQ